MKGAFVGKKRNFNKICLFKYESQHPKSMSYGEELKKKVNVPIRLLIQKIVVAVSVSAVELAQYFMMGTFLIVTFFIGINYT